MRHFSIFVFALIFSFNSFARESTLLDSGWEFCQGDADLSSQLISRVEMAGTGWQTVSVPHCLGSNAKKVELLLDGISHGQRSDGTNCVFIWKDVKLSPGENHVETRARLDGENLSDSCVWNLK